jgi:CBS domain-containing protein
MADDMNDSPVDVRGADAAVATYMTTEIVTVDAGATIRDVARLIADASVGCVVVGSTQEVTAVVSERDVARAVAAGLDPDTVRATEIGSRQLVWVAVDDTIGSVAEEMMEDYVRHVLVRDDSGLAGILSMRDVLSAYVL